jgi:CheY-like chemotaxis protein
VLGCLPLILVVDDEPDILEVLSDLLADAGYRVMTARHGGLALELLERESPRLMLLDVMMPVMSGEELLAELERRNRLSSLAIVVMSAAQRPALAERYGLPYARKPMPARELLALIESALATPPSSPRPRG